MERGRGGRLIIRSGPRATTLPSAAAQICQLLCSTAARRDLSRDRISDLVERCDEDELLVSAERLGVALIVFDRLPAAPGVRAGGTGAAAGSALAKESRRRAFVYCAATENLVNVLSMAGIRSLPLKGVALSESLYGRTWLRTGNDIDLLVAREELAPAVAALRGEGFSAPRVAPDRSGEPLLHFVLDHPGGSLPPVELHWRVHWYEERFAQDMLARAQRDGVWLRPRPTDQLAALLLFYARDGFVGLRLATDVAAWWDRFGLETSATAIEEICTEYPALNRSLRAALHVATRVVGVPGDRAGDGAPLDRHMRLAVGLADWAMSGNERQMRANVGLVDGLLAPPGGMREFLRRDALLRSPASGADARAISRRAGALEHAARRALRYATGLWSLRGGRDLGRAPGVTHGKRSARL